MFHPAMANVLDVVWTKRGLKMVALENENTELTKEIRLLKASLQEKYHEGYKEGLNHAAQRAQYKIRLRFSGQYSELVAQEVADDIRAIMLKPPSSGEAK